MHFAKIVSQLAPLTTVLQLKRVTIPKLTFWNIADVPVSAVQQPANSGALAVLADVAGNAREEMEVATQLKVSLTGPAYSSDEHVIYRASSHILTIRCSRI